MARNIVNFTNVNDVYINIGLRSLYQEITDLKSENIYTTTIAIIDLNSKGMKKLCSLLNIDYSLYVKRCVNILNEKYKNNLPDYILNMRQYSNLLKESENA